MIAHAFVDPDGVPVRGGMRRELPDGAVALPLPFTTADLPRLRFRDGVWEERMDNPSPVPPSKDELAEQRVEMQIRARLLAVDRINAAAGRVRLMIYTDIPGQDALYLEKRAEAVAYVAEANQGGEPKTLADYPLLANETGVTAPTPYQLAQLWLNRSDQFKRVGAATERARMQALIAVSTAPDETTIETIEAAFNEALNGLPL